MCIAFIRTASFESSNNRGDSEYVKANSNEQIQPIFFGISKYWNLDLQKIRNIPKISKGNGNEWLISWYYCIFAQNAIFLTMDSVALNKSEDNSNVFWRIFGNRKIRMSVCLWRCPFVVVYSLFHSLGLESPST